MAMSYNNPPGQEKQFEPGMLYPLEDPGTAVRNVLRSKGILGSPFSPANRKWQQRLIASVLPAFLMKAQGGLGGDVKDLGMNFAEFIGNFLNPANRPSMNEAMSGMGQLQGLLSSTNQMLQDSPLSQGQDLSDPNVRQAVGAKMMERPPEGFNALNYGISGMLSEPDAQLKMLLGAFMPSMGSAMTGGMGKVLGPMAEAYEDYGDAVSNVGTGNFMSLLDMLLGKGGQGGVGPTMTSPQSPGTVMPGGTQDISAAGSSPSGGLSMGPEQDTMEDRTPLSDLDRYIAMSKIHSSRTPDLQDMIDFLTQRKWNTMDILRPLAPTRQRGLNPPVYPTEPSMRFPWGQ